MAKVTGTAGADVLYGTDQRDTIDGLAGIDTMFGGYGNDVYIVDHVDDFATEAVAEGTDTVLSSVSYTLLDEVENLTLTGNADINATGNLGDNILTGNRGDNILDGGGGADTMMGGSGNDTYVINIFAPDGINYGRGYVGDVIIDSRGIDTVTSGASDPGDEWVYIMQNGLENADFSGLLGSIAVTGNRAKNIILTSDGDDTLDGNKGADTMDGGNGANTYIVDHRGDLVIDTFDDRDGITGEIDEATADTLIVNTNYVLDGAAMIETITLGAERNISFTGSDTANFITGSAKKNIIHGGLGNDTIDGGGGKDILYGDGGADVFLFSSDAVFDKPATIADFRVTQGDVLDISNIISFEDGTAISNYIQIIDSGRNSIVKVNNGDGDYIHIATLLGVTGLGGETTLVLGGNLVVEGS